MTITSWNSSIQLFARRKKKPVFLASKCLRELRADAKRNFISRPTQYQKYCSEFGLPCHVQSLQDLQREAPNQAAQTCQACFPDRAALVLSEEASRTRL